MCKIWMWVYLWFHQLEPSCPHYVTESPLLASLNYTSGDYCSAALDADVYTRLFLACLPMVGLQR